MPQDSSILDEKLVVEMLRAIYLPMLAVDDDARVIFVNEAMETVIGRKAGEVMGEPVATLLGLGDDPAAFVFPSVPMEREKEWQEFLTHITFRDQRRPVKLRYRTLRGEGRNAFTLLGVEGLEWWEAGDEDSLTGTRLIFFEANRDGLIVHGHTAWANVLGRDRRKFNEGNLFRYVADDHHAYLRGIWKQVLDGEPARSREVTFLDAQGARRPFGISLFPLRDLHDNVVGVRGTANDLEVEKGLAYALEAAEERFSVLFRESSDPILILSLDGDILSVNQTFEETTGCASEALFSGEKTWSDFIFPDDVESVQESIRRCHREQVNVTVEYRLRDVNGGDLWFEQRHSILHDEHGEPKGILAVARNIHIRKQRELELQAQALNMHERNMQAQALIGRLTDFFARTSALAPDLNDYLQGICEILADMYQPYLTWIHLTEEDQLYTWSRDGVGTEPAVGNRIPGLPTTMCGQVIEQGQPLFYDHLQEDPLCWEDPLVQQYKLNTYLGAPLRDSQGQIRGTLALVDVEPRFVDKMDVELLTVAALQIASRIRIYEEEKIKSQLENHLKQAQKMEAVGMLAGGIAHDFNNILSGILGFTSFLRTRTEPGTDVHRDLGLIETSAERAADLTRQLLAFARRKHFTKTTVRLPELIEETLNILRHSLPKDITIHVEVPETLPLVLGDPGQLNQVLMNLCLNAADAMSASGGRLALEARHRALNDRERSLLIKEEGAQDDFVCIEVTDTGLGMNEEVLAQIFDPFYTTKSLRGGTGLGLSIVYGIVRNHGGDIIVESAQREGSTFSVYLPVYHGDEIVAEVVDESMPVDGSETILVVDDELIVRQMVQEILKDRGYRVLVAASGDEAVDLFEELKETIDLVLLDMVMPGMNGEATFHALRKIDPALPVMLTTGFAKEGQSERLMKEGALGVVYKPYKSQTLLQTIRKALNQVASAAP